MSARTRRFAGEMIGCYELVRPTTRINSLTYWLVRCSVCGTEQEKYPGQLRQDVRKGCKYCTDGSKTHGRSKKDPTYISWCRMLQRVRGSDTNAQHIYMGMYIDPRWIIFEEFLLDMGERPRNMTLDRIDPTLGYFKKNCRWATSKQQNRNKRNTVYVNWDGSTEPLADWAERNGVSYGSAYHRYETDQKLSSE